LISIHKPYYELTEQQELMDRNKYFQGLNDFFKELEAKKIQNRVVMLSRYRVKPNVIPAKEARIETSYVKINSKTVSDLVDLPIKHLIFFQKSWMSMKYRSQDVCC
jgi:excinuclease ABC subunit A